MPCTYSVAEGKAPVQVTRINQLLEKNCRGLWGSSEMGKSYMEKVAFEKGLWRLD